MAGLTVANLAGAALGAVIAWLWRSDRTGQYALWLFAGSILLIVVGFVARIYLFSAIWGDCRTPEGMLPVNLQILSVMVLGWLATFAVGLGAPAAFRRGRRIMAVLLLLFVAPTIALAMDMTTFASAFSTEYCSL